MILVFLVWDEENLKAAIAEAEKLGYVALPETDKHGELIRKALLRNQGFCPCRMDKSDSNRCPCFNLRMNGQCKCGLFKRK
jgi:ferredoxin-thioredoxin reductase catalytic subunit